MTADPPTARLRRLVDRVAGVAVVLALSMSAMPATGFASSSLWPVAGRTPSTLLDLSQLDEALGRGELPVELLVVGSLVALAVGFALTLLVGALRSRRRRSAQDPDPAPIASSDGVLDARSTPPWPIQDADAFQPTVPPSVSGPTPDEEAAEAWAAREATMEIARQTSGWPSAALRDVRLEETPAEPEPAVRPVPAVVADIAGTGRADVGVDDTAVADAPPTWERTEPAPSAVVLASIQSTLAPQADIPPARSTLGTPEAPLVVELHDERGTAAGRRVGPNLPLVAVIGTVAVGVAFSAGAAVGATLGVGAGAAIGLAFAGGAGVAIGAAIALLGGDRR